MMRIIRMLQPLTLLLLFARHLSGYAGYASQSINVVYPANHAVLFVDPLTGAVPDLVVELSIQNFRIPEDGAVHISGEKIGEYSDGVVHAFATPLVRVSGMQLGSHFWTFALVHTNRSAVAGAAARVGLHLEIVLSQDTALPQWHYTPTKAQRRPRILVNLPPRDPFTTVRRHKHCFVGAAAGLFDGQKKMWLQAIAALPQHQWDVRFVAFQVLPDASYFVERLGQLNVSVRSVPLVINIDDLTPYGLTATQAIPTAVQAFRDTFKDSNHVGVSMSAFRQHVDRLHPPFAAAVWQRIVDALHETCQDAVLVMANARSIADQQLVAAARIAGMRAIVMEMANLKPVPLHVDALVAPSHYALHHPTTTEAVTARQRYVLNTGVDTTRFRPRTSETRSPASALFTVGYIGRLSTDKSVGLVIDVARLLLESCPLTCKVRIIGDGPLRHHLESLVAEWELADIVHFTGPIYAEDSLVQEIQHLDVVVSPCFHETLGIAPLEAMSCGVPVVAFASGGVLEYLEHNVNGLVVHDPSPNALYDAIARLQNNASLRHRLGAQARRTVRERFSQDVGVQQFVSLYERLARN